MRKTTLTKLSKIFSKRMQEKCNTLVEIKLQQLIPRQNLFHNKDKMTFQSMPLTFGKEHLKMLRLL